MNHVHPAVARRLCALVLSALAAAAGGCRSRASTELTTQAGRVIGLVQPSSGLGLQICDPKGAVCSAGMQGSAVPAASLLRSGPRTGAQIALADGSGLTVDHDTELQLGGGSHHARLGHGAIVLNVASTNRTRAHIDVSLGSVEVGSGKISLRAESNFAILDVIRGSATIDGDSGHALHVAAGEEARWYRGSAPIVSAGAVLADAATLSDNVLHESNAGSVSRGLGELTARKPGSTDEVRGALKLAAHRVQVRIAGAMARTEIDEVFQNSSDEVLEGVYRFPIPTDATIERLALSVDGKLVEGAFVDRDRAAAIWRGAMVNAAPSLRPQIKDDIVWVPGPWRDPALLEWQRGARFELKIFPIPKHGQRRIVLAYTEAVRAVGGIRHFTYPLPVDPGGTTSIGHFDLDVEVRGQDPALAVRALGYPVTATDRDGARALSFSKNDFTPNGDFSLEWALPGQKGEVSAFGYRSGDERYALLTLRPKLPRAAVDPVHATVIIVDSSRSMFGEGLERAKHLALALARELDPAGSLTLLACDSTCRQLPFGWLTPGPAAAREVERFLSGISAEGASDLTQGIAAAGRMLAAVHGNPRKDIVYLGDGTATVGPIRPRTITSAIRDSLAESHARVTAVGIGSASDLETLSALSRAGGGLALPYAPGQSLTQATLSVLSATYGSALRDVELVLPEGLRAVAPAELDTILAGSEANISARMESDQVDGALVLRGKVGGAPFEQRYEVHVTASESAGNAFVPRVYAAARIADLEQMPGPEAKTEALALSTRFSVQSRYSSLLVLESEAMLRAFGLDRAATSSRFTGQDLAEQSDASGELPSEDSALGLDASSSGVSSALAARAKKRAGFEPLGAVGASRAMDADEAEVPAKASAPVDSAAPRAAAMTEEGFAQPPPALSPQPLRIAPRERPRSEPLRRLIAMRRVWDRKGRIITADRTPTTASITALADAERALGAEPDRRSAVKKAYSLYAISGDLNRATALVDRWLSRAPLDPEALTARADLAARRGERELAIRMLGSVVDVRPDDVAGQRRLARLYRWSGHADLGCRYAIAIAEIRSADAKLLADALRCAEDGAGARWASDALSLVDEKTARLAVALAALPAPDDTRLLGDLRVEAKWSDGSDLDLAILHPDGQRVSWLGAPTRELIAARDVREPGHEGLSLSGAKPGEYAIEIVRSGDASGPVRGELTIFAAGTTRRVPFVLDGSRVTVALVELKMVPRLVPLDADLPQIAEGGLR